MNDQVGGDTGTDADFNRSKQEIIYINGYYINYGKYESSFENFKCIMGEWNGDENDNDIFYYFETKEELLSFMATKNRKDTEFVVTKVFDKNNNVLYDNEEAESFRLKKEVQKEILALLEDTIVAEINAMKSHYTVAEISREALLSNPYHKI